MRHFRRLAALLLALTLTLSLAAPAASAASGGFTDVPAKHWAAAEIRRSAQAGLIRGETATRFGLGHPMTRGAFVSVLCRFFQWPLVDHDGSFTDVPKTLWCRQAIETALVHGAVTTQTDAFRPDDPITREEMAVMLVRALGYGPISGLDLGIDCPFTDVRTNQGYLALAYHLGIVNGTSATAFSPDRSATREQAVVMLTRLYDRYFAAAPAKIGFVSDVAKNISWTGFTDLILSGGRLSASGVMTAPKGTDDFLVQCRLQGSRALLGVTVDAAALSGDPTLQASRVLSAADGFGGVALSVSGMTAKQREGLTALAAALRASLGEDRLLLTVDADGGYDLAALAAQCDGLLLATTPDPVTKNGIRVAPLEPPEEIVRAMAAVPAAARSKLILTLSTTAGGRTEAEVQALAAKNRAYYSDRYAQSYLLPSGGSAVWYHDEASIQERVQLCRLFGIGTVALSDLSALSEGSGILKGIR